MFLLPHIFIIAALLFVAFLSITPFIIGAQKDYLIITRVPMPPQPNRIHNVRKGIVLALAIFIIFICHRDIAALSLRTHTPLFSGSEFDNWLLIVFFIIPFLWFFNIIHTFMFAIVVFAISVFIGAMLFNMYSCGKQAVQVNAPVTKFQTICNVFYKYTALAFFCSAVAVPALWILFLR